MEVGFGLAAAAMNAVVAVLSTRLAQRYPARQLLAPLFTLNCLLLLPLAPFMSWVWSPWVVLLHAAGTAALVISSVAIWDMYTAGGAAPTVTAQSVSPLPAAVATGVLLPGELSIGQVAAAIVVVAGVLVALRDEFDAGTPPDGGLDLVAAVGTGAVTVVGRLLADAGSGVVETYVVRTAASAAVCAALWWPRDVPLRDLPAMVPRAMAITSHLALILLGVQGGGNPAIVQTVVATGPLFAIGWDVVEPARTVGQARARGRDRGHWGGDRAPRLTSDSRRGTCASTPQVKLAAPGARGGEPSRLVPVLLR